ncbi:MAG TPA: SDR family oxidoreductase [bacterium]|nr:SDR family oxidoreductase [bacterium]
MSSKVIVITGASSGIGAALARHLSGQGHSLVLAARRAPELKAVASQVKGLAVVTDVCKRADVKALRDAALKAHGHVDVWVNNAGQGLTRSVLDLTDEDVDLMMSVNVKSALYGMQAIAPAMMERGSGHIINISSFLARVPLAAYRSAYSAAKAALNSLTANLRMDLALSHPKITVSVVMPGLVSTAFSQNAVGGPPQRLTDGVPSQTPQEVAAAIAELIEKPRAELITNPALAAVGQRYVQDVEAFEAKMRTGAR